VSPTCLVHLDRNRLSVPASFATVYGDGKMTTALLDRLPTAATFSKPETTASV
jgi:hypothetical protein